MSKRPISSRQRSTSKVFTSDQGPFGLAIIGAGVAGCALAAELCRNGWNGASIGLWEAGRGPGGRTATRRSRQDPTLRINHGANLFNIRSSTDPEVLSPLLQKGWVEPWKGQMAVINELGELLPHQGQDPLLEGRCFQGAPGMEQICEGLLQLGDGQLTTSYNTLIRSLERHRDRWVLKDPEGSVLAESAALVLTGTLLAHPRSRLTFGWSTPPLQELAERVQNPALNHALASIASLRFEARSSLLLRLSPDQAAGWLALPFRLLAFDPAAQQRWGLWRVCIQPQQDGSCAIVAHSNAIFAAEHIGIYGSRSAMARQLGLTASAEQEKVVIEALHASLMDVLSPWLPPQTTGQNDRQLMRWGAAFPLQPALPEELCWNEELQLGFCGDFMAGPGFGRVEGAMLSAEQLARRLAR